MIEIPMAGVTEYAEGFEPALKEVEGRLVVEAYNESGFNVTQVDLVQLIHWLRVNRPDLLEDELKGET